jgi:hypothetical protein
MSDFKLTKEQYEWLNDKVPFPMFEKYNVELGGHKEVLSQILYTESYTSVQKVWLNRLRSEYIEYMESKKS